MDVHLAILVFCLVHLTFGGDEVVITSSGQYWPFGISETLQIIGRKQCTRECQMRGSKCLAVNYESENLQCEILQSVPNNLTELAENINYQYIAMTSQTSVFSSAVCESSCASTGGHCVQLSSGSDYCQDTNRRCPTNYRFSAELNFCYRVIPILADFQTAMDHCEGIGARLAVLPTMAYIDYLKSERTNGYLTRLKYMVGGQWNTTSNTWRWLDGSAIFDEIDISVCRVDINSGIIAWENKYRLMNLDISSTEEFLCEKVLV